MEKTSYNTPKDFFIYLISMITLYISFTSAIMLMFNYVNLLIPDNLLKNNNILESIRSQIAILIITFPVYLLTLCHIRKDYLRYPEKKNLKIRRWLFYFTLFVAALVIMGDLSALLLSFLSGDITSRFLTKAILIFIFFSALFFFYLKELHKGWDHRHRMIWFWTVSITFLLLIVCGFYLAGSPATARKARMDERRVNDLVLIQNQIIFYWKHKKQLPATITELTSPLIGFKTPVDPVTHKTYSYRIISNNSFELCATFNTSHQTLKIKDGSEVPLEWNWTHPAGYYCFPRAIDPELYSTQK